MLKKTKNVLYILFVILLTISLCACSSSNTEETSEPTETTEVTEVTEVTEAPTTEATEAPTEVPETEAETEAPTEETQAVVQQPVTQQPATQQPATQQPAATTPAATQPAETKPAETTPAATQPAETKPAETAPAVTEAPHEHSYTSTVVAPTCTSDGYTQYTCSCGSSYKENVVSASHSWGNWSTTKAATTQAEGEQTRTCNVCGKSETQSIPKEVIDTAALEAYGRSYAQSLGFVVDTSLGKGNSGYYPGLDYPVPTMQEGYSHIAGCTYATMQQLNGCYTSEESNVLVEEAYGICRYNCLVEYMYTEDGIGYYIFWVFYG